MKIKEWKELDGVLSKYNVKCERGVLLIYNSNLFVSKTDTTTCEKQIIIDWLKLYGIEVEFEKPMTITQNDYNLLKSLNISGNLILVKKYPEFGIRINGLEIPFSQHLFSTLEVDTPYLVSDLLKMKVED